MSIICNFKIFILVLFLSCINLQILILNFVRLKLSQLSETSSALTSFQKPDRKNFAENCYAGNNFFSKCYFLLNRSADFNTASTFFLGCVPMLYGPRTSDVTNLLPGGNLSIQSNSFEKLKL